MKKDQWPKKSEGGREENEGILEWAGREKNFQDSVQELFILKG